MEVVPLDHTKVWRNSGVARAEAVLLATSILAPEAIEDMRENLLLRAQVPTGLVGPMAANHVGVDPYSGVGTLRAFEWGIMSQPRSVRSSQSVGWPFAEVAAVLGGEPSLLLQRATTTAAVRAASIAGSLWVEIASLEIGVNVRLHVRRVREARTESGLLTQLSMELTWEAIRTPRLFPLMLAELAARPLSWGETQLEIEGVYWTPMGPLGAVIDTVLGHRIAEASVRHFLQDVAAQLQTELGRIHAADSGGLGRGDERPAS